MIKILYGDSRTNGGQEPLKSLPEDWTGVNFLLRPNPVSPTFFTLYDSRCKLRFAHFARLPDKSSVKHQNHVHAARWW